MDNISEAQTLLESNNSDKISLGVGMIVRLAENGNAEAQYAEATWHIHSAHGYQRDLVRERSLLQSAVDSSFPLAFYELGVWEIKHGARNKYKNAFGLFVAGAIKGDKMAMIEVARAFRFGSGCFKDINASDHIERHYDSIVD